ncbi:MAG: dipeptidase [Eubacteriales bacterium]
MKYSLFDLHCDTLYEMFMRSDSLSSDCLSVSLKKANPYDKYAQVCAVWSDKRLGDEEAFARFKNILAYAKEHIDGAAFVRSASEFDLCRKNDTVPLILAVEDARILSGDISLLAYLAECGVRILTLLWSGISCIGGAYDTEVGLSDFGKLTVRKCFEYGIIPDISHASRQSTRDVFELNTDNKPVIASHSDSFAVCPHKRNLTDAEFRQIMSCRGLVGINLYCEHLGLQCDAADAVDTVIKHIEHYLSLGGEDTVSFGCDFDGAQTPQALADISALTVVGERMLQLGYKEDLIEKLFYGNAERFFRDNF